MDQDAQQAMDGSPGFVSKSLADLAREGKFSGHGFTGLDATVIAIQFQCGPLQEVGVNGCSIEDVIDVLVARLQGFQHGPFKCRENALAITKLEEAKLWLLHRTAQRQAQHVEGTNAPHVS